MGWVLGERWFWTCPPPGCGDPLELNLDFIICCCQFFEKKTARKRDFWHYLKLLKTFSFVVLLGFPPGGDGSQPPLPPGGVWDHPLPPSHLQPWKCVFRVQGLG